jgi:hypothetical protein
MPKNKLFTKNELEKRVRIDLKSGKQSILNVNYFKNISSSNGSTENQQIISPPPNASTISFNTCNETSTKVVSSSSRPWSSYSDIVSNEVDKGIFFDAILDQAYARQIANSWFDSYNKQHNNQQLKTDYNHEDIPTMKHKRRLYSVAEKKRIVDFYKKCKSYNQAILVIQKLPGCDKITRKMLRHWVKVESSISDGTLITKRRGKPVCMEFENEVFDECIFSKLLENEDDTNNSSNENGNELHSNKIERKVLVLANVAYNYDVIRTCAKRVRDRLYATKINGKVDLISKWAEDDRTKNLKFSAKWIWGALKQIR